ncbi:GtrA family protein [Uliginosibacterium aquaticum]|uniref:GtrA family protein n=1 Tax=Uliginosibacterium aquaticum TaxID=2731212 RepID=A0ABX2IBV8_9RHOO|nr:GtrA family protein [Uliginosibacterium aquaticum]NSL53763.1 GtrA family protein [Uliginosibacterium aquaticum]
MGELFRYVTNGLVATGVHYSVLAFNLHVLGFSSAGLANLVAAMFGIAASFVGNRYFVFANGGEAPWHGQAARFVLLYGAIALLHGAVMWTWADWLQQDYRIGFLIATVMQFVLSYIGNKRLVFKK